MSGEISTQEKRVCQSIIQIFETGKLTGGYGTVALLTDGAGVSYGKHQATDRSNSLDTIIYKYMDRGGVYGSALEPYLDELQGNLTAKVDPNNPPEWIMDLMKLLRQAGESDPLMGEVQDEAFDEIYWRPAVRHCLDMKLEYPLSYAIVYDSCIHSGPLGVSRIRKLFSEVPPARGGDEKKWAESYVRARRAWLAANSNALVRKTVYRMDAFLQIIKEDNWELKTPLVVRGVTIS